MKRILYLFFATTIIISYNSFSQGCVAIRSAGVQCSMAQPMDSTSSGWELSLSYRYFKSDKHYKGRTYQEERIEKGTEVINLSSSVDIALTRQFNNRISLTVGIPFLYNDRSSLYEHGLKERHYSSSKGFGDLRVTMNRWMLDPMKSHKFNFQVGAGIKLPTGNYKYKDDFFNVGSEGVGEERAVDQSIQLGDGGVGAIFTVNAFYNVANNLNTYANFYYVVNPRNTNGTRTYLETLSPKFNDDRKTMSVPDQYMWRVGFSYDLSSVVKGLSIAAGTRMEGLPAKDLVGKSDGWRRPGYVFSFEPGVAYSIKKVSLFASVPVALQRNRIQSVQDKKESDKVGFKVVGDAAFADYSINLGGTFKF